MDTDSRSEIFKIADDFYELAENTLRVYLGNHKTTLRGYERLAKTLTNANWLVYGALAVSEQNNSCAIECNGAILGERIKNALLIYKDYGIAPESVEESIKSAFNEIRAITDEPPEILRKEIVSLYNAAKQECGFKIPEENPADFLVRASTRQWLDKDIIKIERAFLETGKDEWIQNVLGGDISDYTLPMIFKMNYGMRDVCSFYNTKFKENIPENGTVIGKLTMLPIEDILKKEKTVFANTHEYSRLSDDEIRRTITSGVNTYLELLKQYHEELIKADVDRPGALFKEEFELLGIDGCFFGHKVGEFEHIALNKTLYNHGDRLNDSNLDYDSINLMNKLRVLDIDGYIDFGKLHSEWISSAVNDFVTNQTAYLIRLLESGKNTKGPLFYSRQEQNMIKAISQASDRFMNFESRKSMEEFEKILQKVSGEHDGGSS